MSYGTSIILEEENGQFIVVSADSPKANEVREKRRALLEKKFVDDAKRDGLSEAKVEATLAEMRARWKKEDDDLTAMIAAEKERAAADEKLWEYTDKLIREQMEKRTLGEYDRPEKIGRYGGYDSYRSFDPYDNLPLVQDDEDYETWKARVLPEIATREEKYEEEQKAEAEAAKAKAEADQKAKEAAEKADDDRILKPIQTLEDLLQALKYAKEDAQEIRGATPKMTYYDMDRLGWGQGAGAAWATFIRWYPRLHKNVKAMGEAVARLNPTGDDMISVGKGWDNFLDPFVGALSGTNKGALQTNEMRTRLGPLVTQVYETFNRTMRSVAPKMRNPLPGGDLKNSIDKRHDQIYDLIAQGKKRTGYRVEDIFAKGPMDSNGQVIAWKRLATQSGQSYDEIANQNASSGDKWKGMAITLPL